MKDGNLVLNDFSFQDPKKQARLAQRNFEKSPGTERKLQMIRKKEIAEAAGKSGAGVSAVTVVVEEDSQNKRLN